MKSGRSSSRPVADTGVPTHTTRADVGAVMRTGLARFVLIAGFTSGMGLEISADGTAAQVARRPAAAVARGKTLFVAEGRTGNLSVIDLESMATVRTVPVAARLADLVALDAESLLALDDETAEVVVIDAPGGEAHSADVSVRRRIAVAMDSRRAAVDSRRDRVFVASRWGRRVAVYSRESLLGSSSSGSPLFELELSFAPGALLVLPESGHAVVAGAFGGELAVLESSAQRVESERSIDGHNIGGLGLSPDGRELLFTHQVLSAESPTTPEAIDSGKLIRNGLSSIALASLLDSKARLEPAMRTLDEPDRGAGDPAGITVDVHRRTWIALGGVDEVLLLDGERAPRRVAAGDRPTRIVDVGGGRVAVVATHSESIYVVESETGAAREISLGPRAEDHPRDRGERDFFSAELSLGQRMSCHSCHSDGHTAGLLADTLGDGGYGSPKSIPTLLGVGLTDPWGWNGGVKELQDQVHQSVATTMRGPAIRDRRASDIVTYLHSLRPPPPIEPASDAVRRGARLFDELGCAECHAPRTYTTHATYDVGFEDETGRKKFNPPSLRGAGQRSRFLHDGRARSLRDVFGEYRHRIGGRLDAPEREDLLAFLRSL